MIPFMRLKHIMQMPIFIEQKTIKRKEKGWLRMKISQSRLNLPMSNSTNLWIIWLQSHWNISLFRSAKEGKCWKANIFSIPWAIWKVKPKTKETTYKQESWSPYELFQSKIRSICLGTELTFASWKIAGNFPLWECWARNKEEVFPQGKLFLKVEKG